MKWNVLAAACAAMAALAVLIPAGSGAAQTATLISASTSNLGTILVDSRGHTLYLFEKDKNGKSACSASCSAAWPPVIASGTPRAGTGAKTSLLGTTRRADGRMQVTYNRHPLYTFFKDTKKGQTNGEDLNAFGADWYAVSPSGTVVEKKAAAPTSGGYSS